MKKQDNYETPSEFKDRISDRTLRETNGALGDLMHRVDQIRIEKHCALKQSADRREALNAAKKEIKELKRIQVKKANETNFLLSKKSERISQITAERDYFKCEAQRISTVAIKIAERSNSIYSCLLKLQEISMNLFHSTSQFIESQKRLSMKSKVEIFPVFSVFVVENGYIDDALSAVNQSLQPDQPEGDGQAQQNDESNS